MLYSLRNKVVVIAVKVVLQVIHTFFAFFLVGFAFLELSDSSYIELVEERSSRTTEDYIPLSLGHHLSLLLFCSFPDSKKRISA